MKLHHWCLIAGIAIGICLGGVRCTMKIDQRPSQKFDAGSICAPACFVENDHAACLRCIERIEEEGLICGVNEQCPEQEPTP